MNRKDTEDAKKSNSAKKARRVGWPPRLFDGCSRFKGTFLIAEQQAIEIARKHCDQQGFIWLEPVKVESKHGNWRVQTNWPNLGSNAIVSVSKVTGEVVDARFLRR